MKICQTLWCAHKDLLNDPFGWYSPQHHLTAWAYSSLKLKELYPSVELFTDSQGAKVLIDMLDLPYTKCHVAYDDLRCNPCLWAYPKIMTYRRQEEPFIHVDGDIFVWERFDDNLMNARLIAQNLETSTDCYANLFRPLLKRITYVPDIFKDNLFEKYPKSYNAGILGGTDIQSIRIYADEAIKFVDENYLCHSNGNFNMMFEQLLFYSVAQKQNITPACFYGKVYNDNGYALREVADFFSILELRYLHLIGRLKRDKFICDQLMRRFCYEYPDYFDRISTLFNSPFPVRNRAVDNVRFNSKPDFIYPKTRMLIRNLYPGSRVNSNESLSLFVDESKNQALRDVYEYEEKVQHFLTCEFAGIERKELFLMEKKINDSAAFFNGLPDDRSLKIYLNPYLEVFETPFNVINFNPYEVLRGEERDKKIVACVPHLFAEGYREINLDTLCAKIISVIYTYPSGTTFRDLKDKISDLFDRTPENKNDMSGLIMDKLKFLTGTNLIYLDKAEVTARPPVPGKRDISTNRKTQLNSQTILNSKV